jgi:tetratricopeptide (TPR) repeat protein
MEALVIIILIVVVILALFVSINRNIQKKRTDKKSVPDNNQQLESNRNKALIEAAKKRLQANANDAEALQIIARIYYNEKNFGEAAKYYSSLISLVQDNPSLHTDNIDLYQARVNFGLASLQLKKYENARQALTAAFAARKEINSELLTGLGEAEYQRKNYDKAIYYLQIVLKTFPENNDARKYLGLSYYKQRKFPEAAALLRQVLPQEGQNKELVFALANSYNESGKTENALKLFMHLVPDPTYGPASALFAGSILMNMHKNDEAGNIFTVGLKHGNMRTELLLELKHRLATVYLKQNKMEQALALLQEIRSVNPSFKNVSKEIQRYSELVSNKNYNIYLRAATPEFISLCRKCLPFFYSKAKIKVMNIYSDRSDYLDIVAEVKTARWEDSILCRFFRSEELIIDERQLRDVYQRMKALHVGRAYCICPGNFTAQAQTFVEARLIDLMDKAQLIKVLSKIK